MFWTLIESVKTNNTNCCSFVHHHWTNLVNLVRQFTKNETTILQQVYIKLNEVYTSTHLCINSCFLHINHNLRLSTGPLELTKQLMQRGMEGY